MLGILLNLRFVAFSTIFLLPHLTTGVPQRDIHFDHRSRRRRRRRAARRQRPSQPSHETPVRSDKSNGQEKVPKALGKCVVGQSAVRHMLPPPTHFYCLLLILFGNMGRSHVRVSLLPNLLSIHVPAEIDAHHHLSGIDIFKC